MSILKNHCLFLETSLFSENNLYKYHTTIPKKANKGFFKTLTILLQKKESLKIAFSKNQ